jgi:hypothetical protein
MGTLVAKLGVNVGNFSKRSTDFKNVQYQAAVRGANPGIRGRSAHREPPIAPYFKLPAVCDKIIVLG